MVCSHDDALSYYLNRRLRKLTLDESEAPGSDLYRECPFIGADEVTHVSPN